MVKYPTRETTNLTWCKTCVNNCKRDNNLPCCDCYFTIIGSPHRYVYNNKEKAK